jgi:hypothetical protein
LNSFVYGRFFILQTIPCFIRLEPEFEVVSSMRFLLLCFGAAMAFSVHALNVVMFTPPKGWIACAPDPPSSPFIEVGFIAPSERGFRPSLNLSREPCSTCSLREYVQEAKRLHAQSSDISSVRDLGTIPTKAGDAALIELSSSSPWGPTRLMQAIWVQDGTAYLLTSACLKLESLSLQKELLQSFKTFHFVENLLEPVQDPYLREALQYRIDHMFEECHWLELQAQVEALSSALGPYWAFAVLKQGYSKFKLANSHGEAVIPNINPSDQKRPNI